MLIIPTFTRLSSGHQRVHPLVLNTQGGRAHSSTHRHLRLDRHLRIAPRLARQSVQDQEPFLSLLLPSVVGNL